MALRRAAPDATAAAMVGKVSRDSSTMAPASLTMRQRHAGAHRVLTAVTCIGVFLLEAMCDCGATRENVAEMRVGRRVAHALLRVSLLSSRIVASTREYRRRSPPPSRPRWRGPWFRRVRPVPRRCFARGVRSRPALLPASKRDYLDEDHLAVFLLDLLPTLEWQAIADTYAEDRGQPPYDPRMMTVLLLYAYSRGS
jgi:hypothetical protein